jgi:serine/threonine-protein kinase/endoribonuclease IRE1
MAPGSGNGVPAAGTPGWRAPEILKGDVSLDEATIKAASGADSGSTNPSVGGTTPSGSNSSSNPANRKGTRLTKSVDIFALGCLFFYTLVSGDHPFGERLMREVNIVKGDMDLSALEKFGEEGAEATDLIASMLEQDPKLR